MSHAFALGVPHDETTRIRDDVAFFQTVRAALTKSVRSEGKTTDELDHAIRRLAEVLTGLGP